MSETTSLSGIFEIVKSIGLGVTALIGAIVAWRGLNTWRRQISGQHKHETAMKLLRSLLQVRTRIKELRNPISANNEVYEAFKEIEGRDPINFEEMSKRDYLRIVRGNWLNKALDDLDAAKIDTEIVFDDFVLSEVEKISKFIAKLNGALMIREQAKIYPAFLRTDENIKAYEVLYSVGPDDPYGQEIDLIIKNVRKRLSKFIQ